MKEPINWCKYFADIEADPQAITPRVTVKQLYIDAVEHIRSCEKCNASVDRVYSQMPKETFPKPGEN